MNILHLLAPARAGGLERVVQGLAIGQHERGDRVVVAVVNDAPSPEHPFRLPLERAGVEVREIIAPGRAYRHERRSVVELCELLNVDIVHSHGYRPDVIDGGAIRAIGIPTVSTVHGWTRGPLRNRIYEYLHRLALRRFDAVISVSEPMRHQLVAAGVRSDRIRVVRNAYTQTAAPLDRTAARELLGIPPDAWVAGWVGRLSQEKGIDVFVDAMAHVHDPRIMAYVIGDGPERVVQEARAGASLSARIHWAGMVDEAGRLCSAFDAFVLSSRTEGIPIALLEAMASGTPVVATRVGGVPDVVRPHEALLVEPEKAEQLAAAIVAVRDDPSAAAERAQNARIRLAVAFGRDQWLDAHERVYAESAERRSSAGRGSRVG
jgi:glycosyltransferase involved in cell wall biosynthesis